jgi:zinc protease
VVTFGLLLRAGGLREPADRAGLAALTTNLLESGAGDRTGPMIAEELETLGIQLGSGASWDLTHLDITGTRARIGPATEILASVVRDPTFPLDEVERLRAEQLAGIMQRRAEPRGLANETAARAIFSADTPFSRPLGGTPATVEAITRGDVVDFHAGHFSADGAAIVVAGEIDADDALSLAASRFGDWGGSRLEPDATRVSAAPGRRVLRRRPSGRRAVGDPRRAGGGIARSVEDYFAIQVLNAILGGAFSSRLNLNLRERHGFTYGVSSAFVMRRHPGPFVVSTAVQTEVTAAALREIVTEVHAIREDAVTAAELEDARSYLAGTFPLSLQTTSGVASRLSEIYAYDLPLDYFDDYRERILEVGADQVLAAARTRIQPEALTVVVVGDAATIRGPLEELDLGPVEVVDPQEVG